MEDILDKNIFDDKDLCKLAPDYSSTSFMLRMQARRTLSKDTHTHGITKPHHTSAWQRKAIKHLKHDYKMNHEIVKIKNNFNNIKLKNQIMVKNVDNISPQSFKYLEDLYQDTKNETDPLLLDFFEDTAELVVLNDKDFKIKEKQTFEKATGIAEEEITFKPEDTAEENNQATDEKILRIECRLNRLLELDQQQWGDTAVDEQIENEDNEETKEQVDNVLDFHASEIDSQVDSLESLLTTMAIALNTDKEIKCLEETVHEANINFMSDGNEKKSKSIQVIQQRPIQTTKISDITDVISVTPIKKKVIEKESDKISDKMKKYVEKWKDYVSKKKDYIKKQREQTLNNFFEKLAMKKKINTSKSSDPGQRAMLLAKDGMYQHRYKVQKHIIALQKAKLEEQNRIIEELKYDKIIEASKQSVDDLREEVRKTYKEIDRNLKPKLKCLGNDLKIQIEEPSLVLHCLKVPQFLQRMEKRAREREEKHAVIRERRRQMEEDRLRLKQQAELAKAEMDKEEKIKIMRELREKRKREKIESIRKKQYAERMRALNVMADLHYEKYLKTKYGINPLRILLNIKRDNIEKVKAHYSFQLKKNVFLHWMWRAEDMWYERNYKAEDFYRKKLLRKAFDGLKKNTQELELQKQVAEDFYDLYVLRLVFRKFREAFTVSKKQHEEQLEKAVRYYECDLLFKAFIYWRTLPALNAIKREQEARKAKWRQKVLQVVPDYTPPDD